MVAHVFVPQELVCVICFEVMVVAMLVALCCILEALMRCLNALCVSLNVCRLAVRCCEYELACEARRKFTGLPVSSVCSAVPLGPEERCLHQRGDGPGNCRQRRGLLPSACLFPSGVLRGPGKRDRAGNVSVSESAETAVICRPCAFVGRMRTSALGRPCQPEDEKPAGQSETSTQEGIEAICSDSVMHVAVKARHEGDGGSTWEGHATRATFVLVESLRRFASGLQRPNAEEARYPLPAITVMTDPCT